jgi:hypothetical protein
MLRSLRARLNLDNVDAAGRLICRESQTERPGLSKRYNWAVRCRGALRVAGRAHHESHEPLCINGRRPVTRRLRQIGESLTQSLPPRKDNTGVIPRRQLEHACTVGILAQLVDKLVILQAFSSEIEASKQLMERLRRATKRQLHLSSWSSFPTCRRHGGGGRVVFTAVAATFCCSLTSGAFQLPRRCEITLHGATPAAGRPYRFQVDCKALGCFALDRTHFVWAGLRSGRTDPIGGSDILSHPAIAAHLPLLSTQQQQRTA